MAQSVEHFLGKEEVTGSSPVSSSISPLPWRCTQVVEGTVLEMQQVGFLARGFKSLHLRHLFLYSSLAQLVEHTAVNRVVVGSSPTGGAIFYLN